MLYTMFMPRPVPQESLAVVKKGSNILLRLKDVVFSRPLSDRDVFSPKLPDTIAEDLDAARPVLIFLDQLAGAPEHLH